MSAQILTFPEGAPMQPPAVPTLGLTFEISDGDAMWICGYVTMSEGRKILEAVAFDD